ncbi:secreted protein, putative [Ixodes scapularis]|uniref:Secreted protein, putative n=1 Tax=Ixodes scapularis TaxID=6945 RepID=B7PGS5_IXOSC|nr:secreted protein, putative [Ixodes scapularis]|eukprot:XP_002401426.1 secreted protein, putative [Ixodes scapularis]
MNATFIAALLILGTLTFGAIAFWEQCPNSLCEKDEDCGYLPLCQCLPPRGDLPGKRCVTI